MIRGSPGTTLDCSTQFGEETSFGRIAPQCSLLFFKLPEKDKISFAGRLKMPQKKLQVL